MVKNLTEGKPLNLLFFFALPMVAGNLFQQLYNMVDTAVVGKFVGEDAVAAVGSSFPIVFLSVAVASGLSMGCNVVVSQLFGARRIHEMKTTISTAIISLSVLGLIIMALGTVFAGPLLQLLGTDPDIMDDSRLYLRIYFGGAVFLFLYNTLNGIYNAQGDSKTPLIFLMISSLTNIVLDFLLVGVLRGGIVGAASATVISQMVGGIGPMFYFFNRKNSSLLHFVRPKFSAKALGNACANGSSELMTNLSASLVSALYNLQLMKLIGADGVAAYGVLMYVGFIFAAVFIGYAQGCAPIISYHYGAENHDELKNLFRKSITMLAIAGVAMFASAQLMATPLAKMFVGYDTGLMELTEHALKLYAFSFLLCGFNIFSSAFFTALNNGAISAAISFLRTLVFQVFAVLVLPMVLDIDGIWYALVFAEAAALLVSAALLVKNRNRYHYV